MAANQKTDMFEDKKSERDSSPDGNGTVSLRPDSKDQLFNGVPPTHTQPAMQEFATDGSRRARAFKNNEKSESDSSQNGNGTGSLRPESKDQLFNGVPPTHTQPAMQEFATNGSRRAMVFKNNVATKRVVKHALTETPERHTGNCDTNTEIQVPPAVPVDVPPASASSGLYLAADENGPFEYREVQPLQVSPAIFVAQIYDS